MSPPARLLARLTVRAAAGRVLDLGCGGGVQALLAARHAESVVGVDLNPRALAFARFNARLNRVHNVEWREGDLFAPVAGERFDLVVSNPPYVVSPESWLLFRDGGGAGDGICARIVGGLGSHLAEGWLRHRARQLGAARGRALVGPPAPLGGGHGLRRVDPALGDAGCAHLRRGVDAGP